MPSLMYVRPVYSKELKAYVRVQARTHMQNSALYIVDYHCVVLILCLAILMGVTSAVVVVCFYYLYQFCGAILYFMIIYIPV